MTGCEARARLGLHACLRRARAFATYRRSLRPKCRFAAPRRASIGMCLFACLQVSLTSLTEHFNEDPHPQRIRAAQMSPQTVELNVQARARARIRHRIRHRGPAGYCGPFVPSAGTLRAVMVYAWGLRRRRRSQRCRCSR
jgi:hypothetical protein